MRKYEVLIHIDCPNSQSPYMIILVFFKTRRNMILGSTQQCFSAEVLYSYLYTHLGISNERGMELSTLETGT